MCSKAATKIKPIGLVSDIFPITFSFYKLLIFMGMCVDILTALLESIWLMLYINFAHYRQCKEWWRSVVSMSTKRPTWR